MGDVWLVRGLVWRIGMLLRRNVHVGVLVPESIPLPPWFYYHSNISKLTGVPEKSWRITVVILISGWRRMSITRLGLRRNGTTFL